MTTITIPLIFKFTNCIAAVLIFFVAIYRLCIKDYLTSQEGVVSMYLFFFGQLLLATEFKFKFINILFAFLTGPLGKGIFLIFCGSLFLSKKVTLVCVIGGILILLGLLNMFCYAWLKPKGGEKEASSEPAQPSQNVNNSPPKAKLKPQPKKTKKQKEQEMKNIRGNTNQNVQLDFENPAKTSDLFVM